MTQVWVVSMILLWIVVGVLAFLLAGALRQLGIIHMRLGNDPGALITESGLDRGVVAPEIVAPDVECGQVVHLNGLSRRARVVVFVTPTCMSCAETIPHLNEVFATRSHEFDFAVICKGDLQSCRNLARSNRLKPMMLLDESGEIEAAFQVQMTPFAYVLDYEGRVLIRGVANDWRHLESLLDQEGTLELGLAWSSAERDVKGWGASKQGGDE